MGSLLITLKDTGQLRKKEKRKDTTTRMKLFIALLLICKLVHSAPVPDAEENVQKDPFVNLHIGNVLGGHIGGHMGIGHYIASGGLHGGKKDVETENDLKPDANAEDEESTQADQQTGDAEENAEENVQKDPFLHLHIGGGVL